MKAFSRSTKPITACFLACLGLFLIPPPFLFSQTAYVTPTSGNLVAAIDTTTNQIVANIPVAGSPEGVAVAGTSVYVGSTNNTVTVIDQTTNNIIATLQLGPESSFPTSMAVRPDGKEVYVLGGPDSSTLYAINTASNSIVASVENLDSVGGCIGFGQIAFSGDSSLAYVTSCGSKIFVIDSSSHLLVATLTAPADLLAVANGFGYTSHGAELNRISLSTGAVLATLDLPPGAVYALVSSPDGSKLYATSYPSGLFVIDTAAFTVTATLPDLAGVQGIAFTADGSRAYCASASSPSFQAPYVFVVDTASDAVINTISSTSESSPLGLDIAIEAPANSGSGKSNGQCHIGGCTVGEPLDVGSGNVFEAANDYHTFGENPMEFTRYYNSSPLPVQAVTLGSRWRSTYDRYLIVSSSTVVAERADGQQLTFTLNGGVWTPDTDVDMALSNTGATWTLSDRNDIVEVYTVQIGLLAYGPVTSSVATLNSIRARNGYTQSLQYDSSGRVTSVTDSYNRTLVFGYQGSLLQTVTTPDNTVLTYGYASAVNVEGVLDRLVSVSYSTTPSSGQSYLYENSALPFALTGIIDENGNRFTSWIYDSKGRGVSSQHSANADSTTVVYNDSDGSRTVTSALGLQTVYRFTTLQGVPKVTELDRLPTSTTAAAKRLFTYDSNGYPASATDWNGNLTTYTNNSHGLPTVINEAVGTSAARTTTILYDSTFPHLPDSIATPGLTTVYTYDAQGDPLTKTLTDTTVTIVPYSTKGQTRIWTYAWSNALLASVTNPNGNKTALTYGGSGTLVKTTNALGQITSVTSHTGGGLPQTIVDANGVTATLSYDARQQLTAAALQTTAGLLTTSYGHDAAEELISTTLPDGSTLTNGYDTAHRLIAVTDLFNNQIQYALNPVGERDLSYVLNSSASVERLRQVGFDALGHVTQDNDGGPNFFTGQSPHTNYTWDSNGNALTITDPRGNVAQQAFDGLNRLTRIIDAAGGIAKMTYDQHDRPVTVVDPNSGSTTYVYNGFGNVIQRISPDTGKTLYYYDADGNLTQMIDGRGAITNYTYDALDRILTTAYPGDPSENVAYSYDESGHGFGIGRLTSLTDAAGTLSRTYDERGNVSTERRAHGGSTLLTAYTYDPASRIASVTYPSGWAVSYSRDAMGRVQAMNTLPPGGTITVPVLSAVSWQPFGPPNAFVYGNGIAEMRGFDLGYRMIGLSDTGTASLQNLGYQLDNATNVAAITDGVTPGNSQSFGYDTLNHLTSATGSYGSLAYTYTPIGNRQTQIVNSVATTYGYAAHSNQLTSIKSGAATQALGYTGSGNISSITPGSGTATALAYNQANRLASVTGIPLAITGMIYDAFGQRFSKTSGGTTNYFAYGQGGELLEENDNGFPIDYVYLDGRPVAEIVPAAGRLYFLHDDRLGTPQLATDNGQNVVWSTTYQPFGQATFPGGTLTQNLRFPGQYADAETGWSHNGFRDYLPGLGRYLQSDLVGLAGGLNTYLYVSARPEVLIDFSGTDPDSGTFQESPDSRAGVVTSGGYCYGIICVGVNVTGQAPNLQSYPTISATWPPTEGPYGGQVGTNNMHDYATGLSTQANFGTGSFGCSSGACAVGIQPSKPSVSISYGFCPSSLFPGSPYPVDTRITPDPTPMLGRQNSIGSDPPHYPM